MLKFVIDSCQRDVVRSVYLRGLGNGRGEGYFGVEEVNIGLPACRTIVPGLNPQPIIVYLYNPQPIIVYTMRFNPQPIIVYIYNEV